MNWDPKPDSALEIQAWHGHSWMTGHQKKDGWLLLCELRDLSEPRGQSAKLGSISASPPLRWLSCQLWGYLGCLLNALCCIRTTVTVHPPKFDLVQWSLREDYSPLRQWSTIWFIQTQKQGSPSFNHAYDRAWLPLGMAIQAEARLIILSICDWTSVQIPPYVDSSSDTNGNQLIIRIYETVQYFPWQAGPFKPSLRRATWCAPCNKARLRAKTACFDSQFATSEPQGTNTTSYSMCLTNGFHTIWSKVLRPLRLNLEKRKIKTRDSSGKECARGLPRPQCPKQRLNNMTEFSTKATSYGDFRL